MLICEWSAVRFLRSSEQKEREKRKQQIKSDRGKLGIQEEIYKKGTHSYSYL